MKQAIKILILEDNRLDADLIRLLLEKEKRDVECRHVANKKSFLAALEDFSPHIILSDHSLPQFNSSKALELARQKIPGIPFIMVTGTVSEEFAAQIIKQGADDYILKDRLARLPAAIESAINKREAEKEKLLTAENLVLSEKKYRTLFFKSPLPKWIFDIDTLQFLDVNQAAIQHYGYSAEEFLNMTIKDIRPKEDIGRLLNDIKEIGNGLATRQGIWTHRKKNGELITVETTAHVIDYNTRNARMVIINDITEKIKAEEVIRKSEENYRTIMERVSDAFVAIDKNWIYTYVNKKAGEVMRRVPESLIGKNIWEEFPEGIGQPFHKAYYKAMEEQVYIHLEEYYSPFDSWLENHIYPSTEGLSIFFRNITERKKAEQQIIQSEENLKAIFDNSSEGFILMDKHGVIKAFNSRSSNVILINSEKEMKVGRSILDFVEEERVGLFSSVLATVLKGEIVQYDRSYLAKDKKNAWINFSFNPVWKDATIIGLCITLRDITVKKIAEQQKEFDHNNLHALINNTQDLLWSIDREFNLITSNQAFNNIVQTISGAVPEKGINILLASYNQEQSDRYKKYYERAFTGETFTEVEYMTNPVEFWSEISFYPIYEKQKVIGTACFSHDITDRKKAEAELRRLEEEKLQNKIEEQKKITRAILNAQEKERNAIGIELHDNVNQILAGTNLMLSLVKTDPEKNMGMIESSMKYLQDAIQENRKIAHQFVAPDLETEDLVTQLKKLTANMLEAAGLQVQFDINHFDEHLLDSDRKFNIYRIAQEQCTNIVKYAKANKVMITLITKKAIFKMTIADNGIGNDKKTKSTGIGLRNINGRLGLFNGTANIITEPGKGFALEIMIPCT